MPASEYALFSGAPKPSQSERNQLLGFFVSIAFPQQCLGNALDTKKFNNGLRSDRLECNAGKDVFRCWYMQLRVS